MFIFTVFICFARLQQNLNLDNKVIFVLIKVIIIGKSINIVLLLGEDYTTRGKYELASSLVTISICSIKFSITAGATKITSQL